MIDVEKLRRLFTSVAPGELHVRGGDHAAFVQNASGFVVADCGDGRSLGFADLICETINALPELLAIAEAAFNWRDDPQRPGHHPPWHLALAAAVDAARKR